MKKFLKTTDVKPDTIYSLVFSGREKDRVMPVKIVCTPESGWLRGHVEVRGAESRGPGFFFGYANALALRSERHFQLPLFRDRADDVWVFKDSIGYPTLKECDFDAWIDQQMDEQNEIIRKAQAEIQALFQLAAKHRQ